MKVTKLLFIVIFIASALLFFIIVSHFSSIDVYDDVNIIIQDANPEIARNLILSTCFQCHYSSTHKALSGRMHGNPKRLGDFYSSNITQDTLTGIGNWTERELYIFFRTGIKKDGTVAFDMPKYPLLSEQDLSALILFLKSNDPIVRPVKNEIPVPKYSFFAKLYIKYFHKPEKLPTSLVLHPDTSNLFDLGKYLVNAKYSCFDCHSKNSITNNYSFPEQSLGYLKGGNRHANEKREIIYTPGIILNDNYKSGLYTVGEFHNLLTRGVKRNGDPVLDPMFPYPFLNETETKAIYTYLQNCCNE